MRHPTALSVTPNLLPAMTIAGLMASFMQQSTLSFGVDGTRWVSCSCVVEIQVTFLLFLELDLFVFSTCYTSIDLYSQLYMRCTGCHIMCQPSMVSAKHAKLSVSIPKPANWARARRLQWVMQGSLLSPV